MTSNTDKFIKIFRCDISVFRLASKPHSSIKEVTETRYTEVEAGEITTIIYKTKQDMGPAAGRPLDPKQNAFDEVMQVRLLIGTTQ